MPYFIKYIVIGVFIFWQGMYSQNSPKNEWQLRKQEQGISVYSKDFENSKFKELKSIFQIKTSLTSVVALLKDFESYPGWVYRCGESYKVKQISETVSLHYQTVVAPWPVDDRDFIVHVVIQQDPVTGIVTQKGNAVIDSKPEVKGRVRIKTFKANWKITPLKDGFVQIEYQLMVDPGGSVPAWLVNLAVVDGPFDTALAMKEWLFKEKYQSAKISFIKEIK